MDFTTETQYRQEISDLWSRVNQHKAQLAERDKLLEQREATILEQQARIAELVDTLKWYIMVFEWLTSIGIKMQK